MNKSGFLKSWQLRCVSTSCGRVTTNPFHHSWPRHWSSTQFIKSRQPQFYPDNLSGGIRYTKRFRGSSEYSLNCMSISVISADPGLDRDSWHGDVIYLCYILLILPFRSMIYRTVGWELRFSSKAVLLSCHREHQSDHLHLKICRPVRLEPNRALTYISTFS